MSRTPTFMRKIERTAQFKRDYKREKRGLHRRQLDRILMIVDSLVLIYRKPDADTLQRVRLGSHSESSL